MVNLRRRVHSLEVRRRLQHRGDVNALFSRQIERLSSRLRFVAGGRAREEQLVIAHFASGSGQKRPRIVTLRECGFKRIGVRGRNKYWLPSYMLHLSHRGKRGNSIPANPLHVVRIAQPEAIICCMAVFGRDYPVCTVRTVRGAVRKKHQAPNKEERGVILRRPMSSLSDMHFRSVVVWVPTDLVGMRGYTPLQQDVRKQQ